MIGALLNDILYYPQSFSLTSNMCFVLSLKGSNGFPRPLLLAHSVLCCFIFACFVLFQVNSIIKIQPPSLASASSLPNELQRERKAIAFKSQMGAGFGKKFEKHHCPESKLSPLLHKGGCFKPSEFYGTCFLNFQGFTQWPAT